MANPVGPGESLKNWKPDAAGADSNQPVPSGNAGVSQNQSLPGNIRLLKSEIRAESLIKSWERWVGMRNLSDTGDIVFTFVNATTFTVNDDLTNVSRPVATVGRRVRALLSGSTIYGTITAASFSSPNTTVTVVWDSGSLDATLTEVQFGSELRSVGGFQNRPVAPTAPTDQQVLTWEAAESRWKPKNASGITDHDQLTNVTADQHHAENHASRHLQGAADELPAGGLIGSRVHRFKENSGAGADLQLGAVNDGQAWKRSGSSVLGIYASEAARKTNNEIVNNSSVLQNDDDLFFPMVANGVYHFRLLLWLRATSTIPDWKIAFTFPPNFNNVYWGGLGSHWLPAGTVAEATVLLQKTDTFLFGSVNGLHGAIFEGLIVNGVTAGNFQLQWAQNTAHASDSEVLAQSFLQHRRLS